MSISEPAWLYHRMSESRLFYRGEKGESENLGFKCRDNTPQLEELTTLEEVTSHLLPETKDKLKYYLYQDLDRTEYLKIIKNVKFLSCGRSHTFIITNDNQFFCCGYNAYHQCGFVPSHSKLGHVSSSTHEHTVPYLSKVNLHTALNPLIEEGKLGATFEITHATCGWVHSVIVVDSKYILGAGHNFFFQLGHPRSGTFNQFELVPFNPANMPNYVITHLDGGTFFTVLCLNSRVLYGAGSSSTCNFGIHTSTTTCEFTKVHEFDCDVVKIRCGYDHTMVLLKDNRIFAVGKLPNSSVQLKQYTLITSVPHSPAHHVDIVVGKFNYPTYILANDTLYSMTGTDIVEKMKHSNLVGASLYSTNTFMFAVNKERTSIVFSTLDTMNRFSAPRGFYFSDICGGYTTCYAVLKTKVVIEMFLRLKNAYLHAKISDITIVCD